tara:strand:- start:484 stop:1740 length:1257 start_codon:yes stop_codon:yes gene_type:complete
MTVYNHVAGGIVFTGVFCSLFNVNIFESEYTITLTVLSSILPDIDHTKSLIGKLFFPLSKYLSVRFGHRTITHSLVVFFPLVFLVHFIEDYYLGSNDYYLIFLFGYLSHLILDMVTIQGIPLFYPFNKNPCVIPANQDLRLRTGDVKNEGIMLFIFSILTFTLQPLFANGFWSNYNSSFNTINHISREFGNSNRLLEVDYDYKYFGNKRTGKGFLVNAANGQVRLIEDESLVVITENQNTIIDILDFRKTDSVLQSVELVFKKIKVDSLNSLISKKYIINSSIYSDVEINYQGQKNIYFEIKELFNPPPFENFIVENSEVINIDNKIHRANLIIQGKLNERRKINDRVVFIRSKVKNASSYEKDKLITELNSLIKELKGINIDHSELRSLYFTKNNLPKNKALLFTGKLEILSFKTKT